METPEHTEITVAVRGQPEEEDTLDPHGTGPDDRPPDARPMADGSDQSDDVDEQSDQSFPASDPPSWSGLSI